MARAGDQTHEGGRRRTWWRRSPQPENGGVYIPAGVPPRFNLVRDVVEVLAEDPGRAALSVVDREGVIDRSTFARIAGLAAQWAQLLALVGIQPRDRVAIAVGAASWHPLFLGAVKLGAVPVLSPADTPVATLVDRAQSVGARLLVAAGETASAAVSTGTQVPVLALEDATARLGTLSRLGPTADTSAGDPAVIVFREGPGRPSVVVHAHAAAYAARDAAELWLGAGPGDVVWCSFPPGSPEFLWFSVFAPWAVGAETVVHAAPFEAGERLDLIDRLGVTVLCQPAAEYEQLVDAYGTGRHASRIRNAVAVGQMSEETSTRFHAATGVVPLGAFTTAETGLLLTHELGDDPASLGRPLPGLDVCIVDRDGRELPVGAVGEIAVRGRPATLFMEYWRSPDATAAAFVDDVYLTGERAMLGPDGTLHHRGAAPLQLPAPQPVATSPVAEPVAEPVVGAAEVREPAPVYEITPVGAPREPDVDGAEAAALAATAAAVAERARQEAAEERAAERQRKREEQERARAEAAERKRLQNEEKAARKAEEEARKRAEAEARAAEKARLEEERRQAKAAEEERLRAEAEARAAEKTRLEEERRAARAAEEERLRAEADARAAEEARLEEERRTAETAEGERERAEAEARAVEERQRAEAERVAREQAEADAVLEAAALAAAAHAAEEARLAEDERRRAEARAQAEVDARARAAEEERRRAAARAQAEADARARAAEEERVAREARERAEADARERAELAARERSEAEARERADAEARTAAEEAARAEAAARATEQQQREDDEAVDAPTSDDDRSRRGWLRRRSEPVAPDDDLDDEELDAEAQRITASLIERLSAFSHEGPSRPAESNGHEDVEPTDTEGEPEGDRDRA